MSLLDIFDAAHNGLGFSNELAKKRPKIIIILYVLFVPTLLWIVLEAAYIALLTSPFWFLSLFISIGILLSFLIAYLLWRTSIIDYYTPKSFFGLSVIVCLLILSLASFTNRQFGTKNNANQTKGSLGFELSKPISIKNH